MKPNNPTDPGAEMKAREDRARDFVLTNHGWEDPVEISLDGAVEIVAAFAAKEVARVGENFTKACWELSMMQQRAEKAEKVAMALTVLLRAKCSDKEWEALPKELASVADDALARAVEEERESCAKIAGSYEFGAQAAASIRERSQVKGEGL